MMQRLTIDVFCATPETLGVLRDAAGARALARCRLSLQEGGLSGAVLHYADCATPQLIIVEEDDPERLVVQLDQLAEVCAASTRVLVIGSRNDIQLYRTLIGRGISDYLPRPLSERLLLETVAGLFNDARTAPRGRVLSFWGARGGAGSSCLAQNTAWHLGRHLGESVIYIDLDLPFGTSLLAFNVEAKQTVADALRHPERLDEVLMERCMIEYDDQLRILASAGDCRTEATPTTESVETLIDLARRLASVVVLDLPRLWSPWTRHCLDNADELVITAQPDFASVRDCKILLDLLSVSRRGAPAPKLILNKLDISKKTQLAAKDFEDSLGLAPSLALPFEPALFGEAGNVGQMIGETAKTHRVTQSLAQFAQMVAGKTPAARKAGRKFDTLRRWFGK